MTTWTARGLRANCLELPKYYSSEHPVAVDSGYPHVVYLEINRSVRFMQIHVQVFEMGPDAPEDDATVVSRMFVVTLVQRNGPENA